MGIEPELIRLSNGVRVALDPMPGLMSAAVGVWIRVGARWETAEQNGTAHLFEHMAFKGGGARDAKALAEALESVGGVMNAATSYERTSYYARTLSADAPFALDLIADVILAPLWAPDELEKEKGVVLQEMGEAFDAPDDRVFELHQGVVFKGTPLGRPILGTPERLAAVSVASLESFKAAHYGPDRIVIAAAGAYDRAAILELAEKRFGGLKPQANAKPEAGQAFAGVSVEARKLEQTHLTFSWPAPPSGHDDLFAARLLSEIYGGGMSSRLFQEVREKRGLVYAVDSYLDAYEDIGRIGVYAGCAAKDAAEVANFAAGILSDLAGAGPTEGELARAKAGVSAQLLMGAEGALSRAEARAGQVFLRDRLVPFEDIRQRINAVDAASVQAVAARALKGPAAASAIGPKAGLKAAEAFMARFV